MLTHADTNLRKVQNDNPDESKTDGFGAKSFLPPLRTLTNKKGQSVSAKLLGKEGDKVTIEVKGRKHEIDISTLSEKDQEFIKNWEP